MNTEALEINKIYEFYSNKTQTDHFDVGKVLLKDQGRLLIVSYPVEKEPPQLQYVDASVIYRFSANTDYINSIKMNCQLKTEDLHIQELKDLRKGLLSYCRDNDLPTYIELYNSNQIDAYGYVLNIGDDTVIIRQLSENDGSDGSTEIVLGSVTRVAVDIEI